MAKSAFTEGLLPTLSNHHGAIQGLWGQWMALIIPCLHYMGTYLNQTVPMPDFEASTDLHFSLRNGTVTVRHLFML